MLKWPSVLVLNVLDSVTFIGIRIIRGGIEAY
jgi:hypothetical protein